MRLYILASLLFLSLIGLTSCLSREKLNGEPKGIAITHEAISSEQIEPDPIAKNNKHDAIGGKVYYFSEFVKKHKSVDKAFTEVTSRQNVIIDFYADWCGPCKTLGNFLNTIAPQNPHVLIVKVNIDEFPTLADQFSVRSIPTVLLFKNGSMAEKITGFNPKGLKDSMKKIFG